MESFVAVFLQNNNQKNRRKNSTCYRLLIKRFKMYEKIVQPFSYLLVFFQYILVFPLDFPYSMLSRKFC